MLVPDQGPEISLLCAPGLLKLTRAQAHHGGHYSCLASNIAGEARRHFYVEVLGKQGFCVCCGIPGGV